MFWFTRLGDRFAVAAGAAGMADEKKFTATVRAALAVAALLVIVWALYAGFLAYG